MKARKCVICKAPVKLKASRLKTALNPVCGPECRAALLQRERMAKVKFTHCDYCGAELNHIEKSGAFKKNKRFCNHKCSAQWAAQDVEVAAKRTAKWEEAMSSLLESRGLWLEIKNVMPHTPWNRIQFDGMNPLDPAVTLCGPWAARNGVECGA